MCKTYGQLLVLYAAPAPWTSPAPLCAASGGCIPNLAPSLTNMHHPACSGVHLLAVVVPRLAVVDTSYVDAGFMAGALPNSTRGHHSEFTLTACLRHPLRNP